MVRPVIFRMMNRAISAASHTLAMVVTVGVSLSRNWDGRKKLVIGELEKGHKLKIRERNWFDKRRNWERMGH